MDIARKVQPKIKKVIKKFPTEAVISRDEINDLGEPCGENEICKLTGFYHEDPTHVTVLTADKGQYISGRTPKKPCLMVVLDDTARLVKVGDYCTMSAGRFIIRDLGNANQMDIYYDLQLERMDGHGV